MPALDQLEIISPAGEIEFYDLDPVRGITNIGRHADNDVVLESPGVAPFQAVLDHRQKPFQIVVLSDVGEMRLQGKPLQSNTSTALHGWETVEVDGYAMVLLESPDAAPHPISSIPAPTSSEPFSSALPSPAPMPAGAVGVSATAASLPATPLGLATRPPDQEDDVILVELSQREWIIDVEQTAACDVTITNGGTIVAAFQVSIEGVDASWITIEPLQVNLVEGEQATVRVSITPPRDPSSHAGVHNLAIAVTSPNHPGRSNRKGATLTINPYYEFAVGELSPKQQTISWRQRTGDAVLPIANRGNSSALFRIEAQDDERGCGFELQMPGEETSLARQVDGRLPSRETLVVPIRITPHTRRLVGLRKRTYSFTVTTSMPEAAGTSRAVMGKLSSKPLIGPGLIALMLLSMAIFVVMIFNPSISTFKADPPVVQAGTPVALYWEASTFANLNIEGIGQVPGRSGRITVVPMEATNSYRLEANNWLSGLSSWFSDEREVQVVVTPVLPTIRVFEVSDPQVLRGENIILRWDVIGADRVVLKINGAPQELLSTEHVSQRQLTPEGNTTYILEAYNRYTGDDNPISSSSLVQVFDPTPTPTIPPPTPIIEFFRVEPNEIALGDEVVFDWSVSGIFDEIQLDPFGQVDQVGPKVYKPEQEGTLNFWLRAFNGAVESRRLQNVLVGPAPTGTPVPVPPEILDFRVQPAEIVQGDSTPSQLFWLVSGDVSDIQISGPGFGPVNNLAKEGSLPVYADESTFFILTAFGGSEDLIASMTAELTVLEPTPTGTPPPTSTPIPTPWPLPRIYYFRVRSDPDVVTPKGGDPPTYEVVVGSRVFLEWEVEPQVAVTVDGFGPEPVKGSEEIEVLESKNFHLSAENDGGMVADAFLRIELAQSKPPPPPFGLDGDVLGDETVKLTWKYPSENVDEILGFRVYRAVVPPGDDFTPAATVYLSELDSFQWVDIEVPTCGQVYYVVALYFDALDKVERETDASPTSWSTQPCPP